MTHILDEQIHTTAILDAQAHAGRVAGLREDGPHCACGNVATFAVRIGGLVEDCCDTCYIGLYRDNENETAAWEADEIPPVSLPNNATPAPTPVEETRVCLACGGAHIITKCPAIKAAMDEAPGCVQPLGELETAIADNAGLLALLRELDYANPARAEQLLAQAREADHPGRELMASTLEHVVDLRYQISATRDALAERDRTITKLREQLATAHAALGQSVAAMEAAWELADVTAEMAQEGDTTSEADARRARARSEEILTATDMAIVAAKKVLRT